jgi:hypothetical protein
MQRAGVNDPPLRVVRLAVGERFRFRLGYLPELQLSATLRIVVTSSVFEAFAFALAPEAVLLALPAEPLASLWLGFAGAFEFGLPPAEAEAFAPVDPVISTSLFTLALSCDSSPVSCHITPEASVSMKLPLDPLRHPCTVLLPAVALA